MANLPTYDAPAGQGYWFTEDMDPHYMARVLLGKLVEPQGANAKQEWTIMMHYGRESPVLLLRLCPAKREVVLQIPSPDHQYDDQLFMYDACSITRVQPVGRIRFTQARDQYDSDIVHTSIVFYGLGGSFSGSNCIVVSSTAQNQVYAQLPAPTLKSL